MDLAEAPVKDQASIDKAQAKQKAAGIEMNGIANALGIIGWIGIVISIIVGITILNDGAKNTGAIVALFGVVGSLFIVGFAEIIRLLQRIYINTKK